MILTLHMFPSFSIRHFPGGLQAPKLDNKKKYCMFEKPGKNVLNHLWPFPFCEENFY